MGLPVLKVAPPPPTKSGKVPKSATATAARTAVATARARGDPDVLLSAVLALLRATPRGTGAVPASLLLSVLGTHLSKLQLSCKNATGQPVSLKRWVRAHPALRITLINGEDCVAEVIARPTAEAKIGAANGRATAAAGPTEGTKIEPVNGRTERARGNTDVILSAVLELLRATPRDKGRGPPSLSLSKIGHHLAKLQLHYKNAAGQRVSLTRWIEAQPSLQITVTKAGDAWVSESAEVLAAAGQGAAAMGQTEDLDVPPPPPYALVKTAVALAAAAEALQAERTWAVYAESAKDGKVTAIAVATSDGCFLLDVPRLGAALRPGGLLARLFQPGPSVTVVAHNVGALVVALESTTKAGLDATLRDAQVGAELLTRTPFASLTAVARTVEVPTPGLPLGYGNYGDGGADVFLGLAPAWGRDAVADDSPIPPPVAAAKVLLDVNASLVDGLSAAVGVAAWEAASGSRAAAVTAAVAAGTYAGGHAVAFDAHRGGAVASPEVLAALGVPSLDTRVTVVQAGADMETAARLLPAHFRGKLLKPLPRPTQNGDVGPQADVLTADTAAVAVADADADTVVTELAASLRDVDLDIGHRPRASFATKATEFLSDNPADVLTGAQLADFLAAVTAAGTGFGTDDRAGICGCLHRVSRIQGLTSGTVVGATLRIGRDVRGGAGMLTDLLGLDRGHGVPAGSKRLTPPLSVLLLGLPGCGKTTTLRAVAAGLAATDLRVTVVDTSCEIGGATLVAHPSLGSARRVVIPASVAAGDRRGGGGKAGLGQTLLRALENLTPNVLIVDELSAKADVEAVRAAKERGVAVVATAHGDLRSLLRNDGLRGAVGGVTSVTIGDHAAAARHGAAGADGCGGGGGGGDSNPLGGPRKTVAERAGAPLFDVVVELEANDPHRCRLIHKVATAVDTVLDGGTYKAMERVREPASGTIWQRFVRR